MVLGIASPILVGPGHTFPWEKTKKHLNSGTI